MRDPLQAWQIDEAAAIAGVLDDQRRAASGAAPPEQGAARGVVERSLGNGKILRTHPMEWVVSA